LSHPGRDGTTGVGWQAAEEFALRRVVQLCLLL